MLGIAHSSALFGATALEICIEAYASKGIPTYLIVGLPDSAIKESRVRIEAALKASGIDLGHKRVLINLAPADVRKEGSALDVAMTLATLAALGEVSKGRLASLSFIGELGFDGDLRGVPGAIIHARAAKERGRSLVVSTQNAAEAALVRGLKVHPFASLKDLVAALKSEAPLPLAEQTLEEATAPDFGCFSDVRGQDEAKRALLIAAVGGHHILLHGIPGVGKTMLCERFAGLLPDLDTQQELEVLAVHSLCEKPMRHRRPPLRAPHHSSSMPALVGGGSIPKPGEISLAHHGVLFLDELGEFRPDAINALRQPLESGRVTISRSMRTVCFDASFQLLAATNPCPCGNANHPTRRCTCSPRAVERYKSRIGGPISDRFDMSVGMWVAPSPEQQTGEPSAAMRARVDQARAFARAQKRTGLNRTLSGKDLARHARLEPSAATFLRDAQAAFGMSGRATDRVLRVARSIADIAERARIEDAHVAEALALRHETSGAEASGIETNDERAKPDMVSSGAPF